MQDIHHSAWVAPSAEIYGRVTIGEGWENDRFLDALATI